MHLNVYISYKKPDQFIVKIIFCFVFRNVEKTNSNKEEELCHQKQID